MISQTAGLLTIAIAAAVPGAQAAFGPAFSTGPVASNSFIRESNATLILPKAPTGSNGDTALWVGMGTSNGDLIQSIADNYDSSDWEIFAYTLVSTGPTSQVPIEDLHSPAIAGDYITMHYKYDDASGNYTQVASVNGVAVSELSTEDGYALGWGSAVECASQDCGTVAAHSWVDVTITMDVADPNYINTLGKADGVTGDLVTSDGGKTWTVDRIEIPQFTF